eukprot:c3233_g1_i4.p1 GENE.c3233_g1_i4~~c3233_g1_i4.p1  ORF type:complete len:448 (-),score=84.50 c3233_g1_i4:32-1375(-)
MGSHTRTLIYTRFFVLHILTEMLRTHSVTSFPLEKQPKPILKTERFDCSGPGLGVTLAPQAAASPFSPFQDLAPVVNKPQPLMLEEPEEVFTPATQALETKPVKPTTFLLESEKSSTQPLCSFADEIVPLSSRSESFELLASGNEELNSNLSEGSHSIDGTTSECDVLVETAITQDDISISEVDSVEVAVGVLFNISDATAVFDNTSETNLKTDGGVNFDVSVDSAIDATVDTTVDTAVATADTVADEIVADEVVADEVVADEVVADEVVADEVVADEVVADEVVADEIISSSSISEIDLSATETSIVSDTTPIAGLAVVDLTCTADNLVDDAEFSLPSDSPFTANTIVNEAITNITATATATPTVSTTTELSFDSSNVVDTVAGTVVEPNSDDTNIVGLLPSVVNTSDILPTETRRLPTRSKSLLGTPALIATVGVATLAYFAFQY